MSAHVDAGAAGTRSYREILKSSALIGGSSILTVGVSIARAKVTALLLGPAGVGAMGLYGSILDLAHSVAGMGLNSSGVRQIAEANATGDRVRVARTVAVLKRTSIALGVIGMLVLTAFAVPVSRRSFGHAEAAWPIALLSIAVLLRSVADGQAAVIQGTRRIADLAAMSIFAAVASTAVTLGLVFYLADRGIVPSLVATAAVTLAVSWWFRRRADVAEFSAISLDDLRREASPLLRLGLAFMFSAVLMTGAGYIVRVLVRDYAGIAAAGLYQSAWTIGGVYIAFILQAMGSDFYPRLTGVAADDAACNRLVNEQGHVGLLLAGPGVLATLTFAPFVVSLLYHATFAGAAQPLRWICVGMALRVVAWPMGYIILAKGARRTFFVTEAMAALVHVGLAVVLVPRLGVTGATMAFAGLYVWHTAFVFVIVRRLSGFSWSPDNRRLGSLVALQVTGTFMACTWLPVSLAMPLGAAVTAAGAILSLRELTRLVQIGGAPTPVQRLLARLRLARAAQ